MKMTIKILLTCTEGLQPAHRGDKVNDYSVATQNSKGKQRAREKETKRGLSHLAGRKSSREVARKIATGGRGARGNTDLHRIPRSSRRRGAAFFALSVSGLCASFLMIVPSSLNILAPRSMAHVGLWLGWARSVPASGVIGRLVYPRRFEELVSEERAAGLGALIEWHCGRRWQRHSRSCTWSRSTAALFRFESDLA